MPCGNAVAGRSLMSFDTGAKKIPILSVWRFCALTRANSRLYPEVVGALRLFKSALNSNRSLRGGGQRVGGGGNSCKTEKNGDCLDHGAYFTDFFIPDTLV